MKVTGNIITIVALYAGFVHGSTKDIVKMKMYKTDQKTWNKKWSYAMSDLSGLPPASGYKTITKEVTLSIDPASQILWVCTSDPCAGEPKNLDLSNRKNNSVVAIDGTGKPTFSTPTEVKFEIARTAPVKIKTIDVYKSGDDNKLWTIKSVNTTEPSASNKVTYGTTKIRRDTTGLTKKLKFPINTDWFLVVDRGNGSADVVTHFKKGDKEKSIRIDSILVVGPSGTATVDVKSNAHKYKSVNLK